MRARNSWGWMAGVIALALAASFFLQRDGDPTPPDDAAGATSSSTRTPATPTTQATPITTTADGSDPALAALDALETLTVAEPDPNLPPYRRDAFGGDGWDYDPVSRCNTRERVLIEESVVAAVVDDRCRVVVGRWVSLYDGLVTADPADLQIDHLVPLAEAWRSGAARWSEDRRNRFANDLSDPATLIAVSGRTNQSKSDSTPDRWLPPDEEAWCRYAAEWATVKAEWDLSVTVAERDRLVAVLESC